MLNVDSRRSLDTSIPGHLYLDVLHSDSEGEANRPHSNFGKKKQPLPKIKQKSMIEEHLNMSADALNDDVLGNVNTSTHGPKM